jgi:hypothetical protein
MWFQDLTPYTYLKSAICISGPPTLNVGWLEQGRFFESGVVPQVAVARLGLLVDHAATNATRGMHFCDLCPAGSDGPRDESRVWGHAEIRTVGADGTRYAAPSLVHHYVAVHGYRPPQVFVDALLRAADLTLEAATEGDLCLGCASPMLRTRECKATRIAEGVGTAVIVITLACDACGTRYDRTQADV